jgi:DNA-binding Lrp family transcriptional regulator
VTKKNGVEASIIKLLLQNPGEWALQSELWRKLKKNPGEVSRALKKMREKGTIIQNPEAQPGNTAYRIIQRRAPQQADSLIGVPCFLCEDASFCDEKGSITPKTCEKLTQWLMKIC